MFKSTVQHLEESVSIEDHARSGRPKDAEIRKSDSQCYIPLLKIEKLLNF